MHGGPHGYALPRRPFFERCRKVVGEIDGGFHKSTVCRILYYGKQYYDRIVLWESFSMSRSCVAGLPQRKKEGLETKEARQEAAESLAVQNLERAGWVKAESRKQNAL